MHALTPNGVAHGGKRSARRLLQFRLIGSLFRRFEQLPENRGDQAKDVIGVSFMEIWHPKQIALTGHTHQYRAGAAASRASGASMRAATASIACVVMCVRSSSAASSLVMLARSSTAIGLSGSAAQASKTPRAKLFAVCDIVSNQFFDGMSQWTACRNRFCFGLEMLYHR